MSSPKTILFLALALGSLSIACGNTGGGGDGGGGSGATGGGGTGGGGTGGTGGGGTGGTGGVVEEHVNLFECGVQLDCEQVSYHISADPPSALVCAAELIVSGQPGVLSDINVPGPHFYQDEQLIIVLGDGTALVQSRFRECSEVDCPPAEQIPWEPASAHQLCDIVLGDGVADACAAGDEVECKWSSFGPGQLANCQDVEDRTCADVMAILEP